MFTLDVTGILYGRFCNSKFKPVRTRGSTIREQNNYPIALLIRRNLVLIQDASSHSQTQVRPRSPLSIKGFYGIINHRLSGCSIHALKDIHAIIISDVFIRDAYTPRVSA